MRILAFQYYAAIFLSALVLIVSIAYRLPPIHYFNKTCKPRTIRLLSSFTQTNIPVFVYPANNEIVTAPKRELSVITVFMGTKDEQLLPFFLKDVYRQKIFCSHTPCETEMLIGTTIDHLCTISYRTLRTLWDFVHDDSRNNTRLVIFWKDPGLYGMWNYLIKHHATGKYVLNANMDDGRRSDAWANKVEYLEKHEDVDVVSAPVYFSSNQQHAKRWNDGEFRKTLQLYYADMSGKINVSPLQFFRWHVVNGTRVVWPFNFPHNSPMWRRRTHQRAGWFNQTFSPFSDFEFWLRCQHLGIHFFVLNEALDLYYEDPTSFSRVGWAGASYERRVSAAAAYLFRMYIVK